MADQLTAMRPAPVATHHEDAAARIDSWWRLPSAAAADEAARAALAAMPRADGLLRFSVLRSPSEPLVFLQSLWTSAPAREHYVRHVAASPRASVDDKVPGIERDRALTEVIGAVTFADAPAAKWVTRRLPATDVRALAERELARPRTEPGLVRVAVGAGEGEVVVVEEWTASASPDGVFYEPVGAVAPV
ncbi:hypothetical protein ABZ215_32875 [Amycolatopsis sp. NPDC006131]|uniref:hypothetical protein n=1 Tax=Amycolatopsis sp. NPDC006131 TaxID=3156731 RepID=UPI0033AD7047